MGNERQSTIRLAADINDRAGIEEGVYLEFKKPSEFMAQNTFSKDKFAIELSETVSAFLNSDGGELLVGVQTDKHPDDKKCELLRPLARWSESDTFESLDVRLTVSQIRDIVNSNIMPKPIGIQVRSIEVQVGSKPTQVFVVDVPSSPIGAHQSTKTRCYYRRSADGDEPMLDYEIRNVNSRRAGPLLQVKCKLPSANGTPFQEDWARSSAHMKSVEREKKSFYVVDIVVAASNVGRGTASVSRFDIGIPEPWRLQEYSPDATDVGAYWIPNNELRHVVGPRVTVFWIPDKYPDIPLPFRNRRLAEQRVVWQVAVYSGTQPPAHPIWPASGERVIGVLRLERQNTGGVVPFSWLPWRAFSNEMLETRGAMLLKDDMSTLSIFNSDPEAASWWHPAEDDAQFEALKQRFQVP